MLKTLMMVGSYFLGVAVLGFILYSVGAAIDDRKDAAWFRENMAGEPNDPEKLPVIDK